MIELNKQMRELQRNIKELQNVVQKTAKDVHGTMQTPLPKYGVKMLFFRFLRAYVPQIPVAVVAGIKAESFWITFGLSLLGAIGTALDKCLREKAKIYQNGRGNHGQN